MLFLTAPCFFTRSDIVKPDMPGLTFICLMIMFSLKIPQDPKVKNSVLAGLSLGLAAACKYTLASASIIIFLIVVFSKNCRSDKVAKLGSAALASALGFAIATPFSILDPRTFLQDFSYAIQYYKLASRHSTYLDQFVSQSEVGAILLLVALGGFLVSLRQRDKRRNILILFSFAAMYFMFIYAQQKHAFQNALPIVLVVCIFAAIFLAQSRLFLFLLCLVMLPMVVFDISHTNIKKNTVDSRVRASDWMEKNLPPHSKLALLEDLAWADVLIERMDHRVMFFKRGESIPKDVDYIVASQFEDDTAKDNRGPAVAPRNLVWEREAKDFNSRMSQFPLVKRFGSKKLKPNDCWRRNNPLVTILANENQDGNTPSTQRSAGVSKGAAAAQGNMELGKSKAGLVNR
jgi:hypothetical protein